MYLPTNYVTPQYNASPNSGEVLPPNGWGIQYTNPAQKSCGMGMFDSADWTTWGFAEWATIALGAYLVISLFSDIGKGVTTVKRAGRRRRRARQLQEAEA